MLDMARATSISSKVAPLRSSDGGTIETAVYYGPVFFPQCVRHPGPGSNGGQSIENQGWQSLSALLVIEQAFIIDQQKLLQKLQSSPRPAVAIAVTSWKRLTSVSQNNRAKGLPGFLHVISFSPFPPPYPSTARLHWLYRSRANVLPLQLPQNETLPLQAPPTPP